MVFGQFNIGGSFLIEMPRLDGLLQLIELFLKSHILLLEAVGISDDLSF